MWSVESIWASCAAPSMSWVTTPNERKAPRCNPFQSRAPVVWTSSPVAGCPSEPPAGRLGHRHHSPSDHGNRLMTLQPPNPMTLRDRTTWHLGANTPVAAYLTSLVAISLVNRYVPETHWLLVHLLLLGAVTNAIFVWSSHFADALLRRRGRSAWHHAGPPGPDRTGFAIRSNGALLHLRVSDPADRRRTGRGPGP